MVLYKNDYRLHWTGHMPFIKVKATAGRTRQWPWGLLCSYGFALGYSYETGAFVCSAASRDVVGVVAAIQVVVAGAAADLVVAGAAVDVVIAAVGADLVVPASPADDVIAFETADPVVPPEAKDDVVAGGPDQGLGVASADDGAGGRRSVTDGSGTGSAGGAEDDKGCEGQGGGCYRCQSVHRDGLEHRSPSRSCCWICSFCDINIKRYSSQLTRNGSIAWNHF